MTERLLVQALQGSITETVPFWFMRQAGRYLPEFRQVRKETGAFLDLCYNPRQAAEVTLQPIRRYGMSAAIIFSDILMVPHGMGIDVQFHEGIGPVVETITDEGRFANLRTLDDAAAFLSPVYEALRVTRSQLPEETALIGFAGAPWTLACYMLDGNSKQDFAIAARHAKDRSPLLDRLIATLIPYVVRHLEAQIETGIDAVQIFDSWAGLLADDAEAFGKYVIAPTLAVVSQLRLKHPGISIIGFPRGGGRHLAAYATQTGVDGISIDYDTTPEAARDAVPPSVTLQGNLHPETLVRSAEEAIEGAKRILEAWKDRAMIFNLGHGMVPEIPPENVAALSRFLKDYRR